MPDQEIMDFLASIDDLASVTSRPKDIGNSVIFINGLPGVGKFTVARELKKRSVLHAIIDGCRIASLTMP
jgi:adenylylsulfate kinase-like enzyme